MSGLVETSEFSNQHRSNHRTISLPRSDAVPAEKKATVILSIVYCCTLINEQVFICRQMHSPFVELKTLVWVIGISTQTRVCANNIHRLEGGFCAIYMHEQSFKTETAIHLPTYK